jgi:hypothetical protein
MGSSVKATTNHDLKQNLGCGHFLGKLCLADSSEQLCNSCVARVAGQA